VRRHTFSAEIDSISGHFHETGRPSRDWGSVMIFSQRRCCRLAMMGISEEIYTKVMYCINH
jgi:hypothetical protein